MIARAILMTSFVICSLVTSQLEAKDENESMGGLRLLPGQTYTNKASTDEWVFSNEVHRLVTELAIRYSARAREVKTLAALVETERVKAEAAKEALRLTEAQRDVWRAKLEETDRELEKTRIEAAAWYRSWWFWGIVGGSATAIAAIALH